ncbi:putative ribonuclease H-like domain-containing protein, partial [Tanacetum coccineum]
ILRSKFRRVTQLQEVTPDSVDTSGPIFDDEPMHKVQNGVVERRNRTLVEAARTMLSAAKVPL